MRQLIKKRTLSPNNVNVETKRILKENGFSIPNGIKSRIIVNSKEYVLTTTSYKQEVPDARQYDTSCQGLVTLWLRDGNFYIFDRHDLVYGSSTRELGPEEFVQIISKTKFSEKYLLDGIRVLSREQYRSYVIDGLNDAKEDAEILKYI